MLKKILSCVCACFIHKEKLPAKPTILATTTHHTCRSEHYIPWLFSHDITTQTIDCKNFIAAADEKSPEYRNKYFELTFDECEECIKIDFKGQKIVCRGEFFVTKTLETVYIPFKTLQPTKKIEQFTKNNPDVLMPHSPTTQRSLQKIKTVDHIQKCSSFKSHCLHAQTKPLMIIITHTNQLIIFRAQPFAHLEKLHDVHYRFK